MVSTNLDRVDRVVSLLRTLLDYNKENAICRYLYNSRKSSALPKGINYTNKEWNIIRTAIYDITFNANVSIQKIFDLEEIVDHYQKYLFLRKMEE